MDRNIVDRAAFLWEALEDSASQLQPAHRNSLKLLLLCKAALTIKYEERKEEFKTCLKFLKGIAGAPTTYEQYCTFDGNEFNAALNSLVLPETNKPVANQLFGIMSFQQDIRIRVKELAEMGKVLVFLDKTSILFAVTNRDAYRALQRTVLCPPEPPTQATYENFRSAMDRYGGSSALRQFDGAEIIQQLVPQAVEARNFIQEANLAKIDERIMVRLHWCGLLKFLIGRIEEPWSACAQLTSLNPSLSLAHQCSLKVSGKALSVFSTTFKACS